MDIAGLRRELEEQLERNPHRQAPDGFRSRFDHMAEDYEAAEDEEARSRLEAQLRQVRDEAEAAANAGIEEAGYGSGGTGDLTAAADGGEAEARLQEHGAPGRSEPAQSRETEIPTTGPNWPLIIGIVIAVAAAAWFFLRD